MNARWRMLMVRMTRRLWFRSALHGLAGILTALLGVVAKPLISPSMAAQNGVAAVGHILGILASSMRAVTTFSWSTPFEPAPDDAFALQRHAIGCVACIDVERLQPLAERADLQVRVEVSAGSFVAPGRSIARLSREVEDELARDVANAFVVSDTPKFEQDPRSGLVVLTEIAQRALSPAINDPDTAIDVLGTATRLLRGWARARQHAEAEEVQHQRVFMPALDGKEFSEDVFAPLARDSAGLLEVAIRLQKSLASLGQFGYAPYRMPAAAHAERALAFVADSSTLPADRRQRQLIAEWRKRKA